MPQLQLLIISANAGAADAYLQAALSCGAACDIATSFYRARELAIERLYSGVLIDLVTLVRGDPESKSIAYDFLNLYPSIRIKWDSKRKEIRLDSLEQSFAVDPMESLRVFIQQRCSSFTARKLRKHPRKSVCLMVMLDREDGSANDSTRTFTVNLSQGGAFVHSTLRFQKGEAVWLTFKDSEKLKFKAKVRWVLHWDDAIRSIPGIGIEFEELSTRQEEKITALLKK